jgi:hypothetical protein
MVEETSNNDMGTMPDLDELAELKDVWQDSPDVDMGKMAKHARFVWWRMRINFAFEVVFALIGLVVLGSHVDASSVPGSAFGIVGSLYCLGALWAAFRIRRGAWAEAGVDALSLVELQIKRAKSSILYIKLNSAFGYLGLVIIALGYWVLLDRYGSLSDERLFVVHWFFGIMTLILLIFPHAFKPYVRRKKEEIRRLIGVAKQLKDG